MRVVTPEIAHFVSTMDSSDVGDAALLRHRVGMDGPGTRFADPALDELTADELIADDATFYRGLPNGSELRVLGLDASAPAVDYALRTGLMQRGWASTHSRTDDFAPVAESHPPKAAR